MTAPPISRAYAQTSSTEWVNRTSGDTVRWSPERDAYLRYNPATASWMQWGTDRKGAQSWYDLDGRKNATGQLRARTSTIDFWVHLTIGFVVFAWAASSGLAGAGVVVLLFFICTGLAASYLHNRHSTAYGVAAVIGFYGAYRELDRH